MIVEHKPTFVDSNAWFAYVNHSDPDHLRVAEALEAFRGCLLTSNFVRDELITLCEYRLGHRVAVRVGEALLDPTIVTIEQVTRDDEEQAWDLFKSRSDKTYSFTDCTSFVLMKRFEIHEALALDKDFEREGFVVHP